MDRETLNKILKAHGLTLKQACKEIYILTEGNAVEDREIRKQFERHGRLSQSTVAMFTVFFEFKKMMKERHDRCA